MWALGVILYEMCCLRYPFPANDLEELEEKVCNNDIDKYSDQINEGFVELFTKLLNKNYKERPTISEVIYDYAF